uniref:F-box-like family protein n=1 Tax=Pithovirus LCPAC401 TaxID=2506595 RepID=A0A481ZBB9_9VIRU|nr:MAG: F-box-like family protein [Pithovirus LCPAC401]
MASINETLAKLNLGIRDLDNLSLAQLETVFKDLTVREISALCEVSRRFNSICSDESFWRNKVSDDYGIHRKCGDTWRKTARNMYKINMINLNTKWIDGRTYEEILDDALQNGADCIKGLPEKHLLPYANNDEEDAYFLRYSIGHNENAIQDFAHQTYNKTYSNEAINNILLINSDEINVIYTSVSAYEGINKHLPGKCYDFIHNTLSYEFLRKMIDPILYVMQFSSFPNSEIDHA